MKNFSQWTSICLIVILLSVSVLPHTTYAKIQPWEGNPWEGNPWEGNTWQDVKWEGEDKSSDEIIAHNGKNFKDIEYKNPSLFDFLTDGKHISDYFERVGKGVDNTRKEVWSGTKNTWNYLSSEQLISDSKNRMYKSFNYIKTGEIRKDFVKSYDYVTSGKLLDYTKRTASSWGESGKEVASYLFSKQSLNDFGNYLGSGEIIMDIAEDSESFATGVNPESKQKLDAGERFLAAGSIFIKPVKGLEKLSKITQFETDNKNYQHLKDYDNNKYFTRSVEYNAGQDGTGFTYKIYQRGDINWNMVRTKGAKKGRGLTNAEASAKYGLAPILDDAGSVATLHHSQQKGVGPLYEASTRYHNISNAKRAPLHPYKGKLNPFYPMDEKTRGAFQKVDSINYWKTRGEEVLGGK